jgi:hypothetical protein
MSVALLLATLTGPAEARSGWVPKNAWRAVKKAAKLFKTNVTMQQSRGLQGRHARAYIVGARARLSDPLRPAQKYYLVTKNKQSLRWEVTPLARGDFVDRIDGNNPGASVNVPVFREASKVGHGVEVRNVAAVTVSEGSLLARKQRGRNFTLYVQGQPLHGGAGSTAARATLRAKSNSFPNPGPLPTFNEIPVHFGQTYRALGAGLR